MNLSRRRVILGSLGLLGAHPLLAAPPTPPRLVPVPNPKGSGDLPIVVSQITLPAKRLRGYGTLSGVYEQLFLAGGSASTLAIECENADKATLLQAKLLLDLTLLPGAERVTVRGSASDFAAVEAGGQGFVAALRLGREVMVLSATAIADLDALRRAHLKAHQDDYADTSDMAVPMYLDRWDKHGFQFYSYTWQEPKADYVSPVGFEGRKPGYDFAEQFHWAQSEGVGFVFWDTEAQNDTAEGLMNDPWIDWAVRGATAADVPIHINLSASPPTWLLNRYRDETQKMPQYSGGLFGPGDPETGGQGMFPWNADAAGDAEMGMMQATVRKYADLPNIVGWLEPHGETVQSAEDFWLDFGPAADRRYQQFLREKYKHVAEVNARWYGSEQRLRLWEDIRVPEIAAFLGWGADALDLTGEWRIGYEPNPDGSPFDTHNLNSGNRGEGRAKSPSQPAPAEWFAPTFDDSAWGKMQLPGNDRLMFTSFRPAVFRRRFTVPTTWRNGHPKVWLYVWDLKGANVEKTAAYLNGVKVGEYMPQRTGAHTNYGVFEVSAQLTSGDNHIALRLPLGALDYRVYLSPHPPTQYPALGPRRNAEWVDFADWQAWSRVRTVERSADMIRQVDPNRGITQMAPNYYCDVLKPIIEDYGGQFHDTGYMGGFYADFLPSVMRGSDLPFDVEPGGPADTPAEFLHMMGLYLTEGVQGVSYFIDIGNVMWNAPIREVFERYLPLYHMIGKYHAPKSDLAVLYDERVVRLLSNPWGEDYNITTPSSYWAANMAAPLGLQFPCDGITGPDFSRGNAANYKVIVDTNSCILDDERIAEIEKYVRNGGTFITFGQTGRHTPTEFDAWPISRLTGYGVTHIGKYTADGQAAQDAWHPIHPAPGQTLFTPDTWKTTERANGLSLKKIATDTQDLLLWEDGSVAVGMRPLGKGHIIHVGAKFTHAKMFDRFNEPGNLSPEIAALITLYGILLDAHGVRRLPASAPSERNAVLLRHYVSNNGLHDVWVLWNQEREKTITTDLVFATGLYPATAAEVRTGESLPITRTNDSARLSNLTLAPLETRMFLTPRGQIETAALDWLRLQRGWWQGTTAPSNKRLPTPEELQTHTLALTEGWAFRPLDGIADTEIAAMAQPTYDDSTWERRDFGIWSLPDHRDIHHGLLRKRVTVPAHWKTGTVGLWMQSWANTTFLDRGRVYLDGKIVRAFRADGLTGDTLSGVFTPGSTHTLAVEIESHQPMAGARGHTWLTWWPAPAAVQDLSGTWIPSHDALNDDAPITLPGPWDTLMARRTVAIPAEHSHHSVMLAVEQQGRVTGVIMNGTYLRRHHHAIGPRTDLNITPYVHFGADNEVVLVYGNSPGTGKVLSVALHFYDKGVWP